MTASRSRAMSIDWDDIMHAQHSRTIPMSQVRKSIVIWMNNKCVLVAARRKIPAPCSEGDEEVMKIKKEVVNEQMMDWTGTEKYEEMVITGEQAVVKTKMEGGEEVVEECDESEQFFIYGTDVVTQRPCEGIFTGDTEFEELFPVYGKIHVIDEHHSSGEGLEIFSVKKESSDEVEWVAVRKEHLAMIREGINESYDNYESFHLDIVAVKVGGENQVEIVGKSRKSITKQEEWDEWFGENTHVSG